MDTFESSTPQTEDRRPLGQQLQGLQRGLALLARTRSRDDRRVILGCLLKDLDALRERGAAAPPHLSKSLAALEAEALAWRAKLGAPVAADDDPATKPARRGRRKEDPYGPPDPWTAHPDAHDGAPAAQVVSQE